MSKSCCSKFYKVISYPDILGPFPQLKHKNQDRYKTLFGSFLTLLCIIVSIMVTYKKFLIRDITTEENIESAQYFEYSDLNSSKIHFQFEYWDENKMDFIKINNTFYPDIFLIQNATDESIYNETNNMKLTLCPNDFFNDYDRYISIFEKKEIIHTITSQVESLNLQKYSSLCFPESFETELGNNVEGEAESYFSFNIDSDSIQKMKAKLNTKFINFVVKYYKVFVYKNEEFLAEMKTDKISLDFLTYQQYEISLQRNK